MQSQTSPHLAINEELFLNYKYTGREMQIN